MANNHGSPDRNTVNGLSERLRSIEVTPSPRRSINKSTNHQSELRQDDSTGELFDPGMLYSYYLSI